jgi:hypothetical protein
MAVEMEVAIVEPSLQPCEELAAEDAAEHLDGKEERPARSDPACVVRSEAAGGDHAVDMWMVLEALVPGVEHAEEADLCAEVPWVTSNFRTCCWGGRPRWVHWIFDCARSELR